MSLRAPIAFSCCICHGRSLMFSIRSLTFWTRCGLPLVLLSLICGSPQVALAQRESTRESPVWLDPNKDAPLGSKYHVFQSATVNKRVSCLVWLPPAYKREPDRKFPVIYWLHGANGNQRMCAEKFLPFYVEMLKQKLAPAAIVVAVNGIPLSYYGDSADGKCPVESVIIKDLIPDIDKEYRTIASREGRLIEGFSMGGCGAARLGFKYPEVFGAVVINSGGPMGQAKGGVPELARQVFGSAQAGRAELPDQLATKNVSALRRKTRIRIAVGDADSLQGANKALHETLEKLEIPHIYIEVPGVDHDPQKFYETLGKRAFRFHLRAFGENDPAE